MVLAFEAPRGQAHRQPYFLKSEAHGVWKLPGPSIFARVEMADLQYGPPGARPKAGSMAPSTTGLTPTDESALDAERMSSFGCDGLPRSEVATKRTLMDGGFHRGVGTTNAVTKVRAQHTSEIVAEGATGKQKMVSPPPVGLSLMTTSTRPEALSGAIGGSMYQGSTVALASRRGRRFCITFVLSLKGCLVAGVLPRNVIRQYWETCLHQAELELPGPGSTRALPLIP